MKNVTALAVVAATGWAGPPPTLPPKPAQTAGPPPAWAETATASKWLVYGSYCWRTACADYLPPQQRPGVPMLAVARGAAVRFHLRFTPSTLALRLIPSGKKVPLSAGRVATWRTPVAGIVSLEARAAAGTASYVIRIRFG